MAACACVCVSVHVRLIERVEQLCALFNCGTEQARVGVGTWLHVTGKAAVCSLWGKRQVCVCVWL